MVDSFGSLLSLWGRILSHAISVQYQITVMICVKHKERSGMSVFVWCLENLKMSFWLFEKVIKGGK